mmetsp:Transcript_15695/g.26459  ORF Transcript_15695/g.26459 Transcript_15695/m.26459 type:complete len:331 (-) Transcript_15695:303-1295(-)
MMSSPFRLAWRLFAIDRLILGSSSSSSYSPYSSSSSSYCTVYQKGIYIRPLLPPTCLGECGKTTPRPCPLVRPSSHSSTHLLRLLTLADGYCRLFLVPKLVQPRTRLLHCLCVLVDAQHVPRLHQSRPRVGGRATAQLEHNVPRVAVHPQGLRTEPRRQFLDDSSVHIPHHVGRERRHCDGVGEGSRHQLVLRVPCVVLRTRRDDQRRTDSNRLLHARRKLRVRVDPVRHLCAHPEVLLPYHRPRCVQERLGITGPVFRQDEDEHPFLGQELLCDGDDDRVESEVQLVALLVEPPAGGVGHNEIHKRAWTFHHWLQSCRCSVLLHLAQER